MLCAAVCAYWLQLLLLLLDGIGWIKLCLFCAVAASVTTAAAAAAAFAADAVWEIIDVSLGVACPHQPQIALD